MTQSMNEAKVVISADLEEGYCVRIGDDLYAVDRILSVSIIEPPLDGRNDAMGLIFIASVTIGMAAATQSSWVVGLILGLLLFLGVSFCFDKLRGFPRDVTIELDKKGPRVVAAAIPKLDAERLQKEIESIVASAAKSEAEKQNRESC